MCRANEGLETIFSTIHFAGALAFVALLLAHIGAALWHHFGHRDTVLKRMTWGA